MTEQPIVIVNSVNDKHSGISMSQMMTETIRLLDESDDNDPFLDESVLFPMALSLQGVIFLRYM